MNLNYFSRILVALTLICTTTACDEDLLEKVEQQFYISYTKYFGPSVHFDFYRHPTRHDSKVMIRITTEEPLTIHNIYLNLENSCSQIPNWMQVFPIHMERGGVAFIQTDCDSILDLHIISDRNWSYKFDKRKRYYSLPFDSDPY